jgi:hypothetical protein
MEHLVSSIIGSGCAEILTLPICTVKTIYQTNLLPNKTISQIISHIYSTQGFKGFFQASVPAIASQILSTSSKYYLYHRIKEFRQTNSSDLFNNSINGALGGVGGSLLSHPFDVWKNYLQRGQKLPILSIKILYSGYSGSFIKNIVLYSVLFPVYDFYKLHTPNSVLAAIGTTLTCSIITQPVDYYKTVLMSGSKFTGWTNPYKGFGLLLSRSIPHFMISMSVTDTIKKLFY